MYTLVFVFAFMQFSVVVPGFETYKACEVAGNKIKQDFAVGTLQPSGGAFTCVVNR